MDGMAIQRSSGDQPVVVAQQHNDACVLCRTMTSSTLDSATHHNDLWFSDGSVVLRAEQTLFRVHISFLSRHSTVFKDTFAIPQPQPLETIEGCAVVRMHDTAMDLSVFLRALYDGP